MREYSPSFYAQVAAGSASSANAIVPIVLDLVSPRSVVDVGCGLGAWLAAAIANGVDDALGIDGDYVDVGRLLIPRERFVPADLERPIVLGRRYDLVMSLEVAEHLPESAADAFVESLVRLGPAVLFSAAIPDQGGEHHVNEQWPQYWADRFAAHGYIALDCIRDRVWNNSHVEPWYAQNSFLYVSADRLASSPKLEAELARCGFGFRPLVHPRQWAARAWKAKNLAAIEQLLDAVPVGAAVALVDEGCLSARSLKPWRVHRLFEREGVYWGPPAGDEAALAELETLRRGGAAYLAVAWGAYWWLEHYPRLREYVRENLKPVTETEILAVFDLGAAPPARP